MVLAIKKGVKQLLLSYKRGANNHLLLRKKGWSVCVAGVLEAREYKKKGYFYIPHRINFLMR